MTVEATRALGRGEVLNENGNVYKKSGAGKIVASVFAGYGALKSLCSAKVIGDEIKLLNGKMIPKRAGSFMSLAISGAIVFGLVGLGAGWIVNKFINNSRSKDADNKAILQKLNEKQ